MSRFVVFGLVGAVLFIPLLSLASIGRLWMQSFIAEAGISFFDLIGMRLRKVDPKPVLYSKILLQKCGCPEITNSDLEAHVLSGGRVTEVARAFVNARRDGVEVEWNTICSMDRDGLDVVGYVKTLARK